VQRLKPDKLLNSSLIFISAFANLRLCIYDAFQTFPIFLAPFRIRPGTIAPVVPRSQYEKIISHREHSGREVQGDCFGLRLSIPVHKYVIRRMQMIFFLCSSSFLFS